METEEFYVEFGKVVYALVMANGNPPVEEKDLMIELVGEHVRPLLRTDDWIKGNEPWKLLFSFLGDGTTPEKNVDLATDRFLSWLEKKEIRFREGQRTALMNVLRKAARVYGKLNENEMGLLERFEAALPMKNAKG